MPPRSGWQRPACVILACGLVGATDAAAELYVWVDPEGHTHVSDDPEAASAAGQVLEGAGAGLETLWGERLLEPSPRPTTRGSSSESDRVERLLRGAVDDLRRGENARAAATLESVLRLEPGRPEAHWYLALLDRQRGRLESAEGHLEAFLTHAGDDLDGWRASARRRLDALADERRLEQEQAAGPLRLVAVQSPNFRIHYDAQLGEASADYAGTVMRYLEDAHAHVASRLDIRPRERTGVVLYARAAYLAAYRHRFSFPTVGFFDGRIHVSSAAHPGGELRALLFHEYTHAVFNERTGGHRPFWLNEGLAELAERASRQQEPMTRSERALLRRRLEADEWIPLRRLEPGFSGLGEVAARLAYLESTAAAHWIQARTDAASLRRLLDRLGAGESIDASLRAVVGLDTNRLDEAVRNDVLVHFPEDVAERAGPAPPS